LIFSQSCVIHHKWRKNSKFISYESEMCLYCVKHIGIAEEQLRVKLTAIWPVWVWVVNFFKSSRTPPSPTPGLAFKSRDPLGYRATLLLSHPASGVWIFPNMERFWYMPRVVGVAAFSAPSPLDTPIFCKFLHKNTTESSEIWRHWSYWLIESCCVVFMRKTYSLELKIEFNGFTVSLRGGWL